MIQHSSFEAQNVLMSWLVRDKIWIIFDQKEASLYSGKGDIELTFKLEAVKRLYVSLKCWTLECSCWEASELIWHQMIHIREMWIDLCIQIQEVGSILLVLKFEFEHCWKGPVTCQLMIGRFLWILNLTNTELWGTYHLEWDGNDTWGVQTEMLASVRWPSYMYWGNHSVVTAGFVFYLLCISPFE